MRTSKFFFVRLFALVVLAGTSMVIEAPSANARERNADIICIAKTIDGEARSEPPAGKIAVGLVVKARAGDSRWPSSICSVVQQRGQFNGYRKGSATPEAMEIAREVLSGEHSMHSIFKDADPSNRDCIRYFDSKPQRFMREVVQIGGHYFGC